MKKFTIVLFMSLFVMACNQDKEAMAAFEKNSKTMDLLFKSYANENVDYSKFNENAVFRGTLFGSKDSLYLDEIKEIHKEFFKIYDVEHLTEFNYLPGVNPETGKIDGSVRMYYDMKVTRTATDSTEEKSVIIPIYESFDFDEEGKALFIQWYCDWTASIGSLEN